LAWLGFARFSCSVGLADKYRLLPFFPGNPDSQGSWRTARPGIEKNLIRTTFAPAVKISYIYPHNIEESSKN
jgi:hypothetical protein